MLGVVLIISSFTLPFLAAPIRAESQPLGHGNQHGNNSYGAPPPTHSGSSAQLGLIPLPAQRPAQLDGIAENLPKPEMGDRELFGSVIVDRLEMASAQSDFFMTYDWQAWFGGDYNKAVVRLEGEIDQGSFKNARNELLWGHALTPYWDSHLGIRYDSGLGAGRTWGALGFQGYAPYRVYVEATGYVGEGGRTAFRLETEYDLLITQKLILQPRIEMNFYSRRDPSRLISSGLSNIEAGLRLRYELKREFAPYIGIEWASAFGSAADQIRAQGVKPEETRFIAGVHFWF